MAAVKDLAFPLVIVCLVFIRGYSPLPTTSQVPETNPNRPLTPTGPSSKVLGFSSDDYTENGEEPVTPVTEKRGLTNVENHKPCDYNLCLESQIPCADLFAQTRCLCPGFTLNTVVPDVPRLTSVSFNGSEVVAQWCAPYSYVTAFIVTVNGKERQRFREDQRSGVVGDIDHMTEVCLVAVNDVGDSKGSCLTYQLTDSSLPLKAGLIGGGLGFLLLFLLAVLLCRHKKQRKQEAGISMHDTAETE
ncbi:leucine-rich repeat neuronal protein 4 [Cyclopterus lumpus]|uniref:LRRN4 C-terminal-like protein n=1 Tax=Cyclopterus lumpus TaxID=8103 RepID=A0A8C2ZBW5_CYCLU|nr:leucine-rich repeat neuronal protein 4 [Cyclopterus lumpus]